jgi:FAD/FMN-containing dehydrogenase
LTTLSRATAPNSLTIWVHNIKKDVKIRHAFKPQGCKHSIDTAAVTFGAGTQMGDLNAAVNAKGLNIVSGGQHGVSYGGYASGGGHSALGPTYGMAADNILELEIVSPGGDVLTINECQHQDLFWAMRGVSIHLESMGGINAK